uniref:Capsid protein n=1 Tax=Betatorquevirus homini12 TaxID=3048398 RepID=A0AAU7ST00_9VIRU
MPYWWRPTYYRRRRRLWRRRIRAPFRRRRWRRRRRVRKFNRKLKRITLKEWQPSTINKLKVVGNYPLYEGTRERTMNNFNQYMCSIAPARFPGGGLFSIFRMSLYSLYEMHRKARNWWTKSNCKLPLIKYLGCKVTLYRSLTTDYTFVYTTCGDMTATLETYQSAHPAILQLNKNKVTVTCDNNNRRKKPYKKIFIRPPAMFQNKWYFQKDIAKIPLWMGIVAAQSLDRMYLSSTAESNTMGFVSLNTEFWVYHNWKNPPVTTGYRPNDQFTIWTLGRNTVLQNATYANLIYLANTKDWTPGLTIADMTGTDATTDQKKVDKYFSKMANWGNPFYSPYWDPDYPNYLVTQKTLDEIKNKAKQNLKATIEGFTEITKPLYWECRYNPERDMSHNGVYITQIFGAERPWEAPTLENLKTEGLPLWLLLHGFVDYHLVAKDIQAFTTDHILAISSDYIDPPNKKFYVPIGREFLQGDSPYEKNHRKDFDTLWWFPKLNFQLRPINDIVNSGPATPKLPPDISSEAHLRYQFYFKLGGCPAPMDDVCDPLSRSKWTTPSNMLPTTLLQDPEYPIEYYLNRFDERRGMLTERATKRIKKDTDFKETLSYFTGQSSTTVPTRTTETSSTETSEEEKSETETELDIRFQRRKQKRLRRKLLQLLQLTQNM